MTPRLAAWDRPLTFSLEDGLHLSQRQARVEAVEPPCWPLAPPATDSPAEGDMFFTFACHSLPPPCRRPEGKTDVSGGELSQIPKDAA